MRWIPIEVDLHGALELAAAEPAAGPRALVGPPGAESAQALAALVLREARAFHAFEGELARAAVERLRAALAASIEGEEHDRAGRARPLLAAGAEHLTARLAAAEASAARHAERLASLDGPDAARALGALMARFELYPRAALPALKADPRPGVVVEVFPDGYALEPSAEARAARRRDLLGPLAGDGDGDGDAAGAPAGAIDRPTR